VRRRSDASDADLGVALFVRAIGALVSMRATGVVIDRIGPRLTPIFVAAFGLRPCFRGWPTPRRGFALLAFLVGAASGTMDVAINADAVYEEDASGRPLLNLAHAFFSAAVVSVSLRSLTSVSRSTRWSSSLPLRGLGPFFLEHRSRGDPAAVVTPRGSRRRWGFCTPSAPDRGSVNVPRSAVAFLTGDGSSLMCSFTSWCNCCRCGCVERELAGSRL